MNASVLLHRYPRSWRARYETEFRAMLEDHPVSAMEAIDIGLGAVDAHLRPQAHAQSSDHLEPPEPPAPEQHSPRREWVQAFFFAHLALFVAINTLLVIINGATTAGNWWSLYPLWAWGTILAVHAGLTFPWKGLFGAHLAFYTGLNVGLAVINGVQGGPIWFIWPLVGFGILIAAHALIAFRRINLLQAHMVASVLAVPILVGIFAATGFNAFLNLILFGAQLGVLVFAHWLMRRRNWTLFGAHVVTYAGVLTLLLINNLANEPGDLWVQYPFAMWSVLLIGHALIHFRVARWSGSNWEAVMLEELGTRGQTDRQRRLLSTLGVHIFFFLLGATGLTLLNILGQTGNAWAIWPIGVWYVLLAFHAGYVMAPRRVVGSLLFGWVATSIGLIAIDIFVTDNTWWFWPVMWSAVLIATIAGAMWTRGRPWVGMHALGGLALAFALIVTDLVTGPPLWWFYPVAGIVFSWVVHFAWTLDLSRVFGMSSRGDR